MVISDPPRAVLAPKMISMWTTSRKLDGRGIPNMLHLDLWIVAVLPRSRIGLWLVVVTVNVGALVDLRCGSILSIFWNPKYQCSWSVDRLTWLGNEDKGLSTVRTHWIRHVE